MKVYGKNVLYAALSSNHKIYEVYLRNDIYEEDKYIVSELKKRNIKIHLFD